MIWSTHYPGFTTQLANSEAQVEVADIGCGFGGLLVALSPVLPSTLMVGMELRTQVLDYVTSRINALRSQSQSADDSPGPYQNISALRTNTMKFMPNYFRKGQLSKIFICFPDPHFKQRKHKARIISSQLNAEYAYILKPGGMLYTITDVEELHHWMVKHFEGDEAGDVAELWERVSQEDLDADPCVKIMSEETEEGKKVSRNNGKKFIAVFRRKPDPDWPQ
jgi:tRNA (guanine-N7-)-methyltransferase